VTENSIPNQDSYAVFGHPIKHSRSPVIHAAFADAVGERIIYRAVNVAPDEFETSVQAFFAGGGGGLNITVPFKERAFALAASATPRAKLAGAANLLYCDESRQIIADNTDGAGLVTDIQDNLGWQISGRKILILGAGGAVRGILPSLFDAAPESVFIVNRTADKARVLSAEFSGLMPRLSGGGFDDLPDIAWDLIINGTSAGITGELPDLSMLRLAPTCCCYDVVYGAEPTPFMRWAAANTAWAVADGIGMLVEQAAESFWLWRGKRPETGPVIDQLRSSISG
jgi:shikimate dehydrogenase